MRGFTHSSSFTDFNVNLLTDRVTTTSEHRFLDGEEVTYVATGTPVGIGSTAVGFSTDRLSSEQLILLQSMIIHHTPCYFKSRRSGKN